MKKLYAISLVVLFLTSVASSEGLKLGETKVRIKMPNSTCGQTAIRENESAVQVVSVGSTVGLHCSVNITDFFMSISDPSNGYVCVSRKMAKFARIIDEESKLLRFQSGAKEQIRKARLLAETYGIPLEIVFVDTATSPPHFEKRCDY